MGTRTRTITALLLRLLLGSTQEANPLTQCGVVWAGRQRNQRFGGEMFRAFSAS
jgi:hypothetical protein